MGWVKGHGQYQPMAFLIPGNIAFLKIFWEWFLGKG